MLIFSFRIFIFPYLFPVFVLFYHQSDAALRSDKCSTYHSPSVMEIAEYCRQEKDTLWDETKRLFYPHNVYVDLSDRLYQVKKELLDQMSMDNL